MIRRLLRWLGYGLPPAPTPEPTSHVRIRCLQDANHEWFQPLIPPRTAKLFGPLPFDQDAGRATVDTVELPLQLARDLLELLTTIEAAPYRIAGQRDRRREALRQLADLLR